MINYEDALISSCVSDEQAFLHAQDMHLLPEAFEDSSCARVWAALCANFSEGIPHSKVELSMRMREMWPDEAMGDEGWLSLTIAELDGEPIAADKWLTHVVEAWEKRRKDKMLEDVVQMVSEGASEMEITEFLISKRAEIEDSTQLEEQRIEKEREAMARQNTDRIYGRAGLVELGIPFIDEQCGKLKTHEFVVVAGRPGSGKSSFARDLLMGPVRTKKQPVLMFSLEMPINTVLMALASTNCGVSTKNIEDDFDHNKERLDAEQQRFSKALGKYLFFHENIVEIRDIEHKINLAMRRHRPAVVVVDYLQLVQASHLNVSREQQVAYISRRFKLMANLHRVPMIVLAQLNRGSELAEREPRASDLRESGSIEQDADAVWLLHKPMEPKRLNDVEERVFIQAKRREGEQERFNIAFRGRTTKFLFEPLDELEEKGLL